MILKGFYILKVKYWKKMYEKIYEKNLENE